MCQPHGPTQGEVEMNFHSVLFVSLSSSLMFISHFFISHPPIIFLLPLPKGCSSSDIHPATPPTWGQMANTHRTRAWRPPMCSVTWQRNTVDFLWDKRWLLQVLFTTHVAVDKCNHALSHTHTHAHAHVWFCEKWGHPIGVIVLYCTNCMCYFPTPTLHLNLALTGDCTFLHSPKKLTLYDLEAFWKVTFTLSYLCHYTYSCSHLSQTCAHTHTPLPPVICEVHKNFIQKPFYIDFIEI